MIRISFLKKIFFYSFFYFFNVFSTPKLTVVMVVDQFAYDYIKRLQKNFNYGLKDLTEKGINFTNAHHPHGIPTTGTGHTALNTGTFAKKHGIILNGWSFDGVKKIRVMDDKSSKAVVFSKYGTQDYGRSAKNIMVEGLTDQFVKSSSFEFPHKTFSISYKDRAAIGMSGKLGKPIWFDKKTGIFTSSKAFFKKLPEWLKEFNKKNKIIRYQKDKIWKLLYPFKSHYYKLDDIDFHEKNHYEYSRFTRSLLESDLIYTGTFRVNKKNKNKIFKMGTQIYDGFLKSPFANQFLLDLGKFCVEKNFDPKSSEKMLLWISLSTLDKLGHIYGPNSYETNDLVYHLDKQVGCFLDFLNKKVGPDNLLFVLTADHGVEPIPEIVKEKGGQAYRIQAKKLLKELNEFLRKKYKVSNIVKFFKTSQFYLSKAKLDNLEYRVKDRLFYDIKSFIKNRPGVKNVWTYKELQDLDCPFDSIENFYKQQLYPGRSGDIICQPERYSVFTTYKTGTSHRSGYDYNTNVPLIIYQKGKFENRTINDKVWIPQLPVTLAKILGVLAPPASDFKPLPIF